MRYARQCVEIKKKKNNNEEIFDKMFETPLEGIVRADDMPELKELFSCFGCT